MAAKLTSIVISIKSIDEIMKKGTLMGLVCFAKNAVLGNRVYWFTENDIEQNKKFIELYKSPLCTKQ